MKGFGDFYGQPIDWPDFTLKHRILDNEQPYANTAEPWQIALDQVIPNYQRLYFQLARGHDKTDRFTWWSLLWLTTTHAAKGYCAGVDRDNAALFRDSSKKLKALHPELFHDIEVQKNTVFHRETGSYIETISSDADSAYGLNFDLLIVNDFHAWPDDKFWDVLWTACGKKPGIRVWMESNALTLGSEGAGWVAKFRRAVKEWADPINSDKFIEMEKSFEVDPRYNPSRCEWFHYVPRGFLAKWQGRQLKQWEQSMHPAAYRRLINNEDTSGEESYLTPEQVQNVTTLLGPTNSFPVHTIRGRGQLVNKPGTVVTAIDLGLKKDATAITTVMSIPVEKGQPPKLHMLAQDVLTGSIDDPVQLRAVESTFLSHIKRYGAFPVLIDPWSAASLVQKFPGLIVEWPFTTAHVRELTLILYRVIADKQLAIYPNASQAWQDGEQWDLQRELINAVVKDCSYGQRVDHKAGGYSDRLMSLGMCVHYLLSETTAPMQHISKTVQPKTVDDEIQKQVAEWLRMGADNKVLTIG